MQSTVGRGVAILASLLVTARAYAQERDPAAAEALFAEGRALMSQQRYSEACAKLAESQRLDPGIGTEFHLAVCYEHQGKLASAWATFLEVASLATASHQEERARAAGRRASLLEARLPRLKVSVPPAARLSGLEITRDGIVVGTAQWDVALPVDPGDHQLEVTAPQRRAFAAGVHVAEGETTSFEVPPLEAAAAPAPPAATLVMTAPATESPTPALPPPAKAVAPLPAASERARPTRPAASEASGPGAAVIAVGIAGVAALAAGTTLAVMAISKNNASKDHCSPLDVNRCSPAGVKLRNRAFTYGDWATAGFIVGGAAIATAALLWIFDGGSAPSEGTPSVAVHAGPQAAQVALEGRF